MKTYKAPLKVNRIYEKKEKKKVLVEKRSFEFGKGKNKGAKDVINIMKAFTKAAGEEEKFLQNSKIGYFVLALHSFFR